MSILKSSTCGITDVKLDWNLPKDCSLVNIPEDVPTIFPGEKNILYAMIIGDISKVHVENPVFICVGHLSQSKDLLQLVRVLCRPSFVVL